MQNRVEQKKNRQNDHEAAKLMQQIELQGNQSAPKKRLKE
ncbi:hypothetical protein BVRB_3g066720 [Beta vulgaris subsp. vulgaris]|nr:hypothetical protein BVRB_3g066720 [Beta vulgaris subsp. vulgaris]